MSAGLLLAVAIGALLAWAIYQGGDPDGKA